ncbi:MAG: elongation factor G [Acidobacteria bacterium]|nr:elongation factor G [Acidobacteriota bacterium]
MKVYETDQIRNVALVGHGDSGKTSLTSALLFTSGAVNRLGRVEDGSTVTDFDEDEIERKISLSTGLAHCEWKKNKINLLDTPGYRAFIHDTRATMRVADAALVLVDAVSGVEVQTERVWQFADEYELPRLILINKMDRDRASFERCLKSVQEVFGRVAVPVQMPLGEEREFVGVIDLLTEKAYTYERDASGKFTEGPVPEALREEAAARRETFIEMIAETSDSLMEKFFESGTLSPEELLAGLKAALRQKKVVPVLCTAGTLNMGTTQVLDAIAEWLPSPAEVGAVAGTHPSSGEKITRKISSGEPYSAFVFKTIADPFAGRITMFRVYSGSIRSDSTLYNLTRETTERLGSVLIMQGKTPTPVSEVKAGDIAALTKLKETYTGDTFCDKNAPILYTPVKFPEPAIAFAIEPKSRADEEKISTALAKIAEEDPAIKFEREQQTKELLLAGTGEVHVQVTVGKLKRKYGVEVLLKPPKVPYRETIRKKSDVQGKYKKQTGGHGQYGDCRIIMEPLGRGKNFEFEDKIYGGAIPRQYIPAVEKGIQEARHHGILAGFPVVDFKVTLYDGTYHQVDSSELAFKVAASMAFKKGMELAEPVLLEPIMNVEVYAPEEYSGDIMGDLNSRRGRVQGMEVRGTTQVIRAQVPMAEMLNYAPALTSMTGGRGNYHMEFSHYDEVPDHIAAKIVEEHKSQKEAAER